MSRTTQASTAKDKGTDESVFELLLGERWKMRTFYTILLFLARFDVAIGVATGRNPDVVAADREAVHRWENALIMLEIKA